MQNTLGEEAQAALLAVNLGASCTESSIQIEGDSLLTILAS
jgi:hypothetical protein